MVRTTNRFIFLSAFLLATTQFLWAQGTDLGAIRGTVTDSNGAVVPGASVEVTDVATNLARKLTTDTEGNYEAPALRSGNYKVTVNAEGFTTAEITGIVLRPGGIARADAVMRVKGTIETVLVKFEAPLIQTELPTISATLDNQTLTSLPRDSRDILSFLLLNPNITSAGGALKFVGAQSYGASFSLDGQRSNSPIFGVALSSQPSLETIGELTVQSNSFTAEYAGIANIRVTTKRGAAAYHGSLFYENRNSALAAWSLTDKAGQAAFAPTPALSRYPNPAFNLNEFGGSFGGPVPKLKNTFFFAAFERRMSNSPINLSSTSLPHPTLWTGDFSRMSDGGKPLVPAGVTLTPAEIANDTVGGLGARFIRIPQRLLNTTTTALIQKYFPQASPAAPINASNGRLVDFFLSVPGRSRRNLGTFRLDHDFSARDKIYAVYNDQRLESRESPVASPFTGFGLVNFTRSNQTLSISETHLWGNVINEARGGFNRVPSFQRSDLTMRQFLSSIGFNAEDIAAYGAVAGEAILDVNGHPQINFGSGFTRLSDGGRNTFRPLDQTLITFGDTLTWIKGRHTIKGGFDIVRNHLIEGFTLGRGSPRGIINYSGSGPNAFARFLLGLPADSVTFVNRFRPPMEARNWEHSYFVQDEFKWRPRLTLTLGLRYEVITPFVEANDILVNFQRDFVGPNGRKGRFVVPSQKTIESKTLGQNILDYGIVTADEAGVSRGLLNTDRNNLAPRAGLAWRLTERTVLRGGFGLYYPTAAAQGVRDILATNSFQQSLTKRNTSSAPLRGWPGMTHGFSPLTGGSLSALSTLPPARVVDFDLQSPRIAQYNVTFERELGWNTALRVSYLGSRLHGLISAIDSNAIPPNDIPFATTTGDGKTPCNPDNFNCDLSPADKARRPFPELDEFTTTLINAGRGFSNGLQLELNRRMSGGLMWSFSYTLLDQKSSIPDVGGSSLGSKPYNQFRPETDFARDEAISRHRFIAYGVYELPLGKGRTFGAQMSKWADAAIGGWELTWQMFAKTGYGFTPFWTCDNCFPVYPGGTGSGFPDATGGFGLFAAYRPTVLGAVNTKQGDRIFNPDAFGLPPLGANLFDDPAVAKRNILQGPSTWGFNLGAHKVFRIGERLKTDLGADFNNLLNHPLKSPSSTDFIAHLGGFDLGVDPQTSKPFVSRVNRNPDFGRLRTSFPQEGVDSRRTVRLKLRLTF